MDLKNRHGLSDVVSTLIIIVVAVLIASVATYYSINTTTTRSSYEAITFDKQHIWVNSTGCVAAFRVKAVGGKDLLVEKIDIRKVDCSWSDVYFFRVPTGTVIISDMNLTSSTSLTGSSVSLFGRTYNQASEDIPLISGGEILFYIKNPGYIGIDDIGSRASIRVSTNNARYLTEKNIETSTNQ
jgi:uncharacterized protein (UPF0333 family)